MKKKNNLRKNGIWKPRTQLPLLAILFFFGMSCCLRFVSSATLYPLACSVFCFVFFLCLDHTSSRASSSSWLPPFSSSKVTPWEWVGPSRRSLRQANVFPSSSPSVSLYSSFICLANCHLLRHIFLFFFVFAPPLSSLFLNLREPKSKDLGNELEPRIPWKTISERKTDKKNYARAWQIKKGGRGTVYLQNLQHFQFRWKMHSQRPQECQFQALFLANLMLFSRFSVAAAPAAAAAALYIFC